MAMDVRINDVTTDVNVTDASAMLTPQVLERIVQAVMQRMREHQEGEREAEQDRELGSMRQRAMDRA